MDLEVRLRKERVAKAHAFMAQWQRGVYQDPHTLAEMQAERAKVEPIKVALRKAEQQAAARIRLQYDVANRRHQAQTRRANAKFWTRHWIVQDAVRQHIEAVEQFRARLDAEEVDPAKAKRAKRVVDLTGIVPATNWRTVEDEWLAIRSETADAYIWPEVREWMNSAYNRSHPIAEYLKD